MVVLELYVFLLLSFKKNIKILLHSTYLFFKIWDSLLNKWKKSKLNSIYSEKSTVNI